MPRSCSELQRLSSSMKLNVLSRFDVGKKRTAEKCSAFRLSAKGRFSFENILACKFLRRFGKTELLANESTVPLCIDWLTSFDSLEPRETSMNRTKFRQRQCLFYSANKKKFPLRSYRMFCFSRHSSKNNVHCATIQSPSDEEMTKFISYCCSSFFLFLYVCRL